MVAPIPARVSRRVTTGQRIGEYKRTQIPCCQGTSSGWLTTTTASGEVWSSLAIPRGEPMSRPRLRTLFGGAAVLVLLTPGAAFAHEQRQVGAISFTVGWQHEPTYAGSENAVQLFLKDAKGNPIDDLGDPPSLQVQVITGNQTSDPLALAPSFDEDTGLGTRGEFDAAIIPTRPGDY